MAIFLVPSAIPSPEITRVSATEIQINWNATEDGVDTYFVKYYPILSIRRKRSTEDDLVVVVETNSTEYLISGLDPGLPYVVAVAAGNSAGTGNFSAGTTVGCEFSPILNGFSSSLS